MKEIQTRLYEFRIKYNPGADHAEMNSYHYYLAETAEQAYFYHLDTMTRHHHTCQNISVERRNPWTYKWEDASEVIDHKPVKIEQNED